MSALVIPGVRVQARFDVVPPPPAPSGILGLVGVVDRPTSGLASVTSASEIAEVFGPATIHCMPEIATALRNGVSEVVVSAVNAASAGTATATLTDRDGEDVVLLRARSPGPWGNGLRVAVDEVLGTDGRSVRYVNLRVTLGGQTIEEHRNLVVDPRRPDRDLYAVVNRDSRAIVALDPVFLADNPAAATDRPFQAQAPRAATRQLTASGAAVLVLTAKAAGEQGNLVSVTTEEGRPTLILSDGTRPTLRVVAREVGATVTVRVTVADGLATLRVRRGTEAEVVYAGLGTVAAIVKALRGSDVVQARAIAGGALPAATLDALPLEDTRTIRVRPEGELEAVAEDALTLDEITAAFAGNLFVDVSKAPGATLLPDVPDEGDPDLNVGFLTGGRGEGPSVFLRGQSNSADIVELVPAAGADSTGWALTASLATGGRVNLVLRDGDGVVLEEHRGLTMDPDDASYLPLALEGASSRLVAHDLIVRSRSTSFPRATRGQSLAGGSAPTTADYLAAIDAFEGDTRIDLLAASPQSYADTGLDVRRVHQGLLAYALAAADRGSPAIALGSVSPSAQGDVASILDHANDLRSQRFVLAVPSGADAALAGLLGHLEVYESPTFKVVPALPGPAAGFRESELKRLVDPITGNVAVVQKHKARGAIVVKGIATNGWQINVTRTADMAIREVKQIAEGFIGQLNDEASRNALQQQIVAYFLRLEREGAIVPSTDGKDPAFVSRVYATQQDFAQGIVRIDIAMRPVRAIDYVYATIRVKN